MRIFSLGDVLLLQRLELCTPVGGCGFLGVLAQRLLSSSPSEHELDSELESEVRKHYGKVHHCKGSRRAD